MSTDSSSISVFLYDLFNTPVTGQLLEDHPLQVQMNFTANKFLHISMDSFVHQLNSSYGGTTFSPSYCASDNTTVQLLFSELRTENVFSIQSTACSMLLYGCHDGYKVETHDGCDVSTKDNTLSSTTITLILLAVIVGLLALLCLVFGSAGLYTYM